MGNYINGQVLRVYKLDAAPTVGGTATARTISSLDAALSADHVLACAKSASISQSNSVIDVTCAGNASSGAGTRAVIKGQTSWTVSVDTLYTENDGTTENNTIDLQNAYEAGDAVHIFIGGIATGDIWWYGQAVISSLEMSVTTGEVVGFNASFEGTGDLQTGTITA